MSIPYLPLFVADYEADTAHLTTAEDGAYMRLLRLQWRTAGCTLPNDHAWIKRRVRCTDDEWTDLYFPMLEEFFKVREGRVFQPRLMEEFERVNATSKKRSDAGRKGGRPRKSLKNNETGESPAKANGKHLEPEPDIDNIPPNPPRGETGDRVVLELFPNAPPPRDRFEDFWDVWRRSPHKNRKADARKKFNRLLRNHSAELLIDGAKRYMAARQSQDPNYDMCPSNWLAQERWQETPEPAKPTGFVPSFPLELPVPPRNPNDPGPHDLAVMTNRINRRAWMEKQRAAGQA